MAQTLDRLREEHRAIERLLKAIEHQLAIFERGDRPDYDVLEAAGDYFFDFPDRCHYPKENAVYRRMRTIDAKAANATMGLEASTGGSVSSCGNSARRFAPSSPTERCRGPDFCNSPMISWKQRRHLAEETHFAAPSGGRSRR